MEKKILIADDSESIRELVSVTLESEKYAVVKCVDGQDAIETLDGIEDVKLIITDLNMPRMNGIDLIRGVRKHDVHKYVPVLLLTTESQTEKKNEAKEAGATGWIVKPFVKEKLLAVVKKIIG